MDYALVQNADKNLIFYGVYNTEVEIQDGSDVLCAVRRNYFESGRHQKNRTSLSVGGVVYKTAYQMEDGKPLKWKKMVGSKMTERAIGYADGYYVETLDLERRPVKKSYFDLHHNWLYSEYFSLADRNSPIWTLIPSTDDDKPVVIRKSGRGVTDILYPFEQVLDKELTDKLNILCYEPQIYCRTSSGGFYFCTREEAKQRAEAMKKLLEREELLTEGSSEARVEPAFEIRTEDECSEPESVLTESSDIQENVYQPGNDMTQDEIKTEEELHEDKNAEDMQSAQEEQPAEAVTALKNDAEDAESTDESNMYISNTPDADYQSDATDQTSCAYMQDCPYENTEKLIIESGGKRYYYFGDITDEKRDGRGRTAMSDGKTAYEGGYSEDKRDGFGVYYFKSGKLCYAGSWKKNRRSGLGVAFSPTDGSAFIGCWEDNSISGVGASFDDNGSLIYAGKTADGQREGAGFTYSAENDTFFVGKYKDGEFTGEGTLFDSDGLLLYSGGYKNGMRSGKGTEYDPDGTVRYSGEWRKDRYNGSGTLFLPEGGTLSGTFRAGMADGSCTLTDSSGRVIYTGSFHNDMYNGTGRLFSEDGSYVEGRFVDGEPTGVFNEYDSRKQLIYCGEWIDMRRSGKGIEYSDGQKIYEGGFRDSFYEGDGKLYKDGSLVYAGSFVSGKRNGFGIEFLDDEIVYQGMWKDDLRSGCGILYDDGLPKYAGCFENGMRNGRINEIDGRSIVKKCLYENDELVYMCAYSANGDLLYYGNVSHGMRSGMGCSFTESCEKDFEGIFRDGEPEKPMQVCFKELDMLPVCPELESTEYELYRRAPEYLIEKPVGKGIFTGRLKDGLPEGNGTMLYFDHRYTGMFRSGLANGEGVIYNRDGSSIEGYFTPSPVPACDTYAFADVTYYKT